MDEADLLASVGGIVEDMTQYEDNVIQQAEREAAPKLMGRGFDSLDALAPSYSTRTKLSNPSADLQHFQSTLSKIRSELASDNTESHRAQLLRLQEQMILVYLKNKVSREDFPVQVPREVAAEHQRKYQITNHQYNGEENNGDRKRKATGSLKRVALAANDDYTHLTMDQRLQSIKDGGAQSGKRSRKSMQAWKQQVAGRSNAVDDDEERERRNYLQQRRKIRQKKRRQRLAQLLGVISDENDDDEVELDDELDNSKIAAVEPTKKNDVLDESTTAASTQLNDPLKVNVVSAEENGTLEKAEQKVQPLPEPDEGRSVIEAAISAPPPATPRQEIACPECGQQIGYANGEDPDSTLSQHIEGCQRNDGRRQITRTRTRKQPAIDYADDNSEDEDGNGGRQPITRTRSRKQPAAADPQYKYALDDGDEPKQSPPTTRRRSTTRSNTRSTTTTSRKESSKKVAPQQPLHPATSLALDDLEEWVYEDRVDKWVESGLSKMKEMAERDDKEVPPGAIVYPGNLLVPAWINDRLFPYQRVGLRWMWELNQQEAGGILGDEMGLGKTVQVCSYLGSMAASRKLKSVLIVCPATILQHWLKELSIWSPGLRRILIHKSGETDGLHRKISPLLLKSMTTWLKRARADRVYEAIDAQDFDENDEGTFVGTGYVFVTTYENLRRFPDVWTSQRWSYVVLDEGQKVRNPDADITLTCKRLRTPHRLLLSGTPIQNDLKELWTLFDFVFPGRLGTLPAFESEFAEPVKRGGFSNASPMQVQLAYRCALVLKDLINPYLLRRQKKDIKEVSRMPGKTEQVLFCRLSKKQRDLYEAYLRSDEVVNILRGSMQLFRSITILRKISNHPDLVCEPTESAYDNFVRNGHNQIPDTLDSDDSEGEGADEFESLVERSGKLEVLGKILPLWKKQGHRVLIFCQWTKMLNILQRFMMMKGWKFGRMDGKTSVASRQRLVDTFNTDESYFALLMTTRTGGVGLNLTGANRVIIYDPDWNPQTDSQARARSHRFGQTRPVTIYRLITAGTIEEKIYHRQIFKMALTNRVLQDPKQKRLFSQRDLKDFFTLKADDGSIIKGGTGMTELGNITRGKGVINPEEVARGSNNSADDGDENDDKETLETIMKSKGLAGVFDHEFVDTSDGAKKTTSAREMEEQARKIAEEAVRALRASAREQSNRFEPTWTGSTETSSGRFGHGNLAARRSSSVLRRQEVDDFGRAGFTGRESGGAAPSSKNLLAGLKGMQSAQVNSNNGVEDGDGRFADLLKRIQAYVRRCGGYRAGGGPTTGEILKEFSDVPTNEAAIFRRLLSSVAKVERGKWKLKE